MKKSITLLFLSLFTLVSFAQEVKKIDTVVVVVADSARTENPSKTKKVVQIGNIKITSNSNTDEVQVGRLKVSSSDSKVSITKAPKQAKAFSIGLDLDRLDIGFSRYIDQGSFTLSPENSFLEFEPSKTSNIAFDFFEFKYKGRPNFQFYIAAGLDWNHMRLKQNITLQKNQPQLTPLQDNVTFSKNRFSSRYLRIPVGFDFIKTYNNGEKFHIELGPEFGFLLNGKVKQISKERGKEKFTDDYNLNPFRYGAFARVGYKNLGIYTKYYFSDVFAKDQGPADFKNMSFGLSFGF